MSYSMKQYCHRQILERLCGGLPEELLPQGRPVRVSKAITHGHSSIESMIDAISTELRETGFEMPREYIEMTGAAQKDIIRGVAEALLIYGAVTLVSAPPGNRYVPELAPFTPYYWFHGVLFIYDWTEAEISELQLETTIWRPAPFSGRKWKGLVVAHEAADCGVTWDAQQILEYAVWAEHVRKASAAAKKPKKPTAKPSSFRMITADPHVAARVQQANEALQSHVNKNHATSAKASGAQGVGNASYFHNAFKDTSGLKVHVAPPTHWSAVEARDAAWSKNFDGSETKTWYDPGTLEPFTFHHRVDADVVLKLAELFNLPEVAKLVRWRKEMKINRLKRVQCGYCYAIADLGSYLPSEESAQLHASNPSNLIRLGPGVKAVRDFVYHFRTTCKPGPNIHIYVPFAKFPVHQCTCGKLFWCHEEVEECTVRHG